MDLQSINLDTESMDWMPGTPLFGPGAVWQGHELVQIKTLSDRRAEGEGVAYIFRFIPPEGKVIRVIAVARSDGHIFNLEGGRGTKLGKKLRLSGNYGLNPRGKPHSAFISTVSTALVIYTSEPDEVRSIRDPAPSPTCVGDADAGPGACWQSRASPRPAARPPGSTPPRSAATASSAAPRTPPRTEGGTRRS